MQQIAVKFTILVISYKTNNMAWCHKEEGLENNDSMAKIEENKKKSGGEVLTKAVM